METLFPERQEAVKVLYRAAAQLLDDAANFASCVGRDLNQNRAQDCILLAEKIASMKTVTIHTIDDIIDHIEGLPFNLGYVVKPHALQEKVDVPVPGGDDDED